MPCKRASLFIGALFGNLRGFVCRDFWEKRKVHLGSFLGPGGHSYFKSGRSLGTSVKEQGCPELILDCGAQRARLREVRFVWNILVGCAGAGFKVIGITFMAVFIMQREAGDMLLARVKAISPLWLPGNRTFYAASAYILQRVVYAWLH